MNVITRLAVTGGMLLALPWACASVASAAPIPLTHAPVALISTSPGVNQPSTIAGHISSGSFGNEPGFDPGPYPSRDACERARARYYDPSQLECVPA